MSAPPRGSRTISTPEGENKQVGGKTCKQNRQIKIVNVQISFRAVKLLCFLTIWANFADFSHIIFGAVVDGVSNATLADGFVFGSRRRAENGHILHCLTQLGSSNTHTTYRCAHTDEGLVALRRFSLQKSFSTFVRFETLCTEIEKQPVVVSNALC